MRAGARFGPCALSLLHDMICANMLAVALCTGPIRYQIASAQYIAYFRWMTLYALHLRRVGQSFVVDMRRS